MGRGAYNIWMYFCLVAGRRAYNGSGGGGERGGGGGGAYKQEFMAFFLMHTF